MAKKHPKHASRKKSKKRPAPPKSVKVSPLPRPVYGKILAFDYRCPSCGRGGVVDENTERSIFDSTTGRFTCPKCLWTVVLVLTLTPEPSESGESN